MTAAELSRRECANNTGGHCFDKPCALTRGEPCIYFEENVLAAADMQSDPFRARMFREARADYMRNYQHRAPGDKVRQCAADGCDRPAPPRCRYCPECSERRKLAAQRDRKRQQRNRGI